MNRFRTLTLFILALLWLLLPSTVFAQTEFTEFNPGDTQPASGKPVELKTPELKASLLVTEDESTERPTARLRWNKISAASHYLIYREGSPRPTVIKASPTDSSVLEFVIESNSAIFPNVSAQDQFKVQAITSQTVNGKVVSQLLTEDVARASDVVVAPTEFGQISNLGQYAGNIMRYALPIGITLAVIMMIYAGITFMTSQGQPDGIKNAQEIIQGAILGLVVLILARMLADFLLLPSGQDYAQPIQTSQTQIERQFG